MSLEKERPRGGSHPSDSGDKVVHVYDDIQECDNRLPNWWLATFFGAVVFSFGYWFYFHVFALGESPTATYRRELAEAAERDGKMVAVTAEMLTTMANDADVIAEGKQAFVSTCAPCHAANAGGNVGPNLTDEFWIHSATPEGIYGTVKEGVVAKGMPAWGSQLGEVRVRSVVAFVMSIRNTNVPGGKAPQGERFALGGPKQEGH